MDLHLLTLDKIIKFLMQLENNKNLFILQELLKNKQQSSIYTIKRNMDLVMEIQLHLDKWKECTKSMENNSKLQFDHQIVLLLEIPQALVLMLVEELLQKLRYLFIKNFIPLKEAYHIHIHHNQNKCPFVVGKNSDILNNYM